MYPFGYGLTYGDVCCTGARFLAEPEAGSDVRVMIEVTNAGGTDTQDVIQAYIRVHDSEYAVPNVSLCGFSRVFLGAGETKEISMVIPGKAFTVIDESGERVSGGQNFTLYFGTSQPDDRSVLLSGRTPLRLAVRI